MWLVAAAGVIIVLPAAAVIVYLWGGPSTMPALGSLLIAALPFVVFLALARRRGDGGAEESRR